MIDRQESYHRSFVAMRNALRSILFHNGDCYRQDEPTDPDQLCECPVCIAKAALANEEDWRFIGWNPERRFSMPRELAMIDAWKHYFKKSAGRANNTSAPMDGMLAQILGVDADSVSERDWYVATTIVQWLATNVGQCILFDAGYEYATKAERQRSVSLPKELIDAFRRSLRPDQLKAVVSDLDTSQKILLTEILNRTLPSEAPKKEEPK